MAEDRKVLLRLQANVAQYIAAMKAAGAATRDLHNEIDKTNDRTAWMAQGILALTPAVTTLGAAAVPVISGLATQMTVAGVAAGTMALGFNGVGDALGALNDYQLDPTTANMEKLEQAMAKIGPEGEEFVRFLDSLGPQFAALANTSREGMFPGITEGITEVMDLMPRFNRIVGEVASGIGELASTAGADLAGPEWEAFFTWLETDARPVLVEMGNTLGNFMQGFADMLVAFGPLTRDFSSGFEDMSQSFADWAAGLEESAGFQEFVEYVRQAAPLALDFLGSLSMAFVELAEAAAAIGPGALKGLTTLLDIIGDLLNTPLGPVVIGFAALTSAWGRLNAVAAITGSGVMGKAAAGLRMNLSTAKMLTPSIGELGTAFYRMGQSVENQTTKTRLAMTQTKAFGKAVAPVAGQIGLLALAMTDVDDKMGLTNTTSLALAGSFMGPLGLAVGTTAGLLLDVEEAANSGAEAMERFDASIAADDRAGATDSLSKMREELEALEGTDLSGITFSSMGNLFSGTSVADEIDALERAIAEAEGELAGLDRAKEQSAADSAYYDSLQAETAALEENIAAMRAKREEALRNANAELNYEEALLDTRDAIKEHGKVLTRSGELMDGHRRAGIEVKRELNNQAAAWNDLSDEAKAVPGAFRGAIRSFVDSAVQAGMSRQAARDLARALLDIPTEVRSKIGLDYETALAHARAVKQELDSIDRFVPVQIHVSRTGSGEGMYVSGGVRGRNSADGGTVPTTGLPYADRHPYLLADGEEVISNRFGQADRWRGLLKAINAGRLADGGTVGRSVGGSITVGSPNVSVGGPSVQVFVDGNEVRSIVRSEQSRANDFDRWMDRG